MLENVQNLLFKVKAFVQSILERFNALDLVVSRELGRINLHLYSSSLHCLQNIRFAILGLQSLSLDRERN